MISASSASSSYYSSTYFSVHGYPNPSQSSYISYSQFSIIYSNSSTGSYNSNPSNIKLDTSDMRILSLITVIVILNSNPTPASAFDTIGKTLSYCIQNFGPAHYQGTANYIFHNQNWGPADIYFFDIGYGYLEVWVSQNQVGKLPPHRVVMEKVWERHTGNPWIDAFGH